MCGYDEIKEQRILEEYLGENFAEYEETEEIEFDIGSNYVEKNLDRIIASEFDLEEILEPIDEDEIGISEIWQRKEIRETFERTPTCDHDKLIASLTPRKMDLEWLLGSNSEEKETSDSSDKNKEKQEKKDKNETLTKNQLLNEIVELRSEQIENITATFNERQYIIVKYGTMTAMAYIDTGAFVSVMDKATYEYIRPHVRKNPNYMMSAILIKHEKPFKMDAINGGALQAIGYSTIPTTIGNGQFLIPYQIVTGIAFNIILGRDFMRQSGMEINFKTNTIKISKNLPFRAMDTYILMPHKDTEISAHLHPDLDVHANGVIDMRNQHNEAGSFLIKTDRCQMKNSIAKIVAHNQTDEPVIVQTNSKVMVAKVIPEVDNVLQYLSECLEENRSRQISEKEGVTHRDDDYWEAINKIDLDKSILSPEGRCELFYRIFKQRGALSIYDQIGRLKKFKYEIRMKEHEVFNRESYRVNSTTRTILERKIKHLHDEGVARRYMSEYSSPALLVVKPSSKDIKDPTLRKYRVVIDLRRLNEFAIHLQYCLPIIHETVTELDPQRFRFFSLLDVSDAFYQVQLHEKSYKFTTFKIPMLGSFCLTRLPQGYVGSPSIFQAIMENIFPEDMKKYITCYIDDILIMSETEEEHIEMIERVLKILRQNGLKLKIEKCNICPERLNFLGITLSHEGVQVKSDKCEAIISTKAPRTKKQVRSFLGAVGYYRRYIKDFAKIAKPLHKLTKNDINNKRVPWDDECQEAFDNLKEKLISAPILGRFDPSRQTILRTDSSGIGIGATLSQIIPSEEKKDKECTIAYYSRVLQPHEYNYGITEREALAILSAVRNFATYLRHSTIPFLIKTDHNDLKYIFKTQKKIQESHRLLRWAMYLSGFNFNIQFCPGSSPEIRMVDFLSRHSYEEQNEEIGDLARGYDVGTLHFLEDNCPDCSVDVSEKVSERLTPYIPDKYIIGKVERHKEFEIPQIIVTPPLPQREDTRHNRREVEYECHNVGKECTGTEENSREQQKTEEAILIDESDEKQSENDVRKENERSMNEERESVNESEVTTPDDAQAEEREITENERVSERERSPLAETETSIRTEAAEPELEDLEIYDRLLVSNENTFMQIEKLAELLDHYEQKLFPREEIRKMQREDMLSLGIIHFIEREVLPKEGNKAKKILIMAEDFFIDSEDGLLYHLDFPAGDLVKEYCTIQLYVPEDLVNYIIQELHSSIHLGLDRLIPQIKEKYWFPKMASKVEKYIQNCNICQLQKAVRSPYRAPIKTRKVVHEPGLVWYMDHAGPITMIDPKQYVLSQKDNDERKREEEWLREDLQRIEQQEYKYVLIAVDSYSLYVELIPTKTTTAEETSLAVFSHVICRHSWPRAIVHDRGTAFVNKLLSEFAKQTGIRNYQTAAMNPRANGVSEARVKIVSNALAKLVNERKGRWMDYIPSIQFALNITPTRANGIPPFQLQHGRVHNDPVSPSLIENKSLLDSPIAHLATLVKRMKVWRKVVKASRSQYNQHMRDKDQRRVRIPEEIKEGELCYLRVPYLNIETKGIKRLNIPWRGPFLITDVIDNRLVQLARMSDLTLLKNLHPISRIKCTKMGIDPPQMRHVEGLTIERNDEPLEEQAVEKLQELGLLVTEDMVQPRDDNTIVEQPPEVEQKEQRSEPEINEEREEIEDINSYKIKMLVKLPPRIRTTRQALETTESSYRPIAKLTGYKVKNGDEMFRVLCEGDKPGFAFWTGRETITSEENSSMEVENELELFKDIWESKIRTRREQGTSSPTGGPLTFSSELD